MSEPTTEAGRQLDAMLRDPDDGPDSIDAREAIVAIEVEARDAELARIAKRRQRDALAAEMLREDKP